jgi:hypothetical protein
METLDQYKAYEAWLKTQYGVSIKVFHSDRGGEFMSNAFSEHLQKAGTIRRLTMHDTPEYNGVAERHLLKKSGPSYMTPDCQQELFIFIPNLEYQFSLTLYFNCNIRLVSCILCPLSFLLISIIYPAPSLRSWCLRHMTRDSGLSIRRCLRSL